MSASLKSPLCLSASPRLYSAANAPSLVATALRQAATARSVWLRRKYNTQRLIQASVYFGEDEVALSRSRSASSHWPASTIRADRFEYAAHICGFTASALLYWLIAS